MFCFLNLNFRKKLECWPTFIVWHTHIDNHCPFTYCGFCFFFFVLITCQALTTQTTCRCWLTFSRRKKKLSFDTDQVESEFWHRNVNEIYKIDHVKVHFSFVLLLPLFFLLFDKKSLSLICWVEWIKKKFVVYFFVCGKMTKLLTTK